MSYQRRIATALVVPALAVGIVACGNAATPQASIAPSATPSMAQPAAAPSVAQPAATPSATVGVGQARWESTGSMTREQFILHAHALADGRVLVIGDDTTAEIWEPATGEWHATASLPFPRVAFASVVLRDGRVLVTGGLNDMDQSYSSAYLFDPVTESWEKAAGLMITARTNPSAAVLPDGRVLVAGGYFHTPPGSGLSGGNILAVQRPGTDTSIPGATDIVPGPFGPALATAEIFDPATGQWSETGSMRYARHGAPAVTLADGRVVVAGALDADTGVEVGAGALDSAEVYDASTGRFTLTGRFPALDASEAEAVIGPIGGSTGGSIGQLVPLPDGGAVLIDHETNMKHVGFATQSFRFDATSSAWQEIQEAFISAENPVSGAKFSTQAPGRRDPSVVALRDGRVLVAGGLMATGERFANSLASVEIFDPSSGRWSSLPDMPEPRAHAQAVTLADGSVFIVGGRSVEGDVADPLRSAVRLRFDH